MDLELQTNNLDLSQEFYKESFNKTIASLMKEYGWFIQRDLAYLLRQITLQKIACLRYNTEFINNKYQLNLKFDEDLDALEAIDMFIAYPRCPEFDTANFVKVTAGWEHKYGPKVTSLITKLFISVHRNERYTLRKLFKYMNDVLQEDIDLASTSYTPEQLITNLNKEDQHQLYKETSFEEELEELGSLKLTQKYYWELTEKFISNLSKEDKERFFDIMTCSSRLHEAFFMKAFDATIDEVRTQIQNNFGETYDLSAKLQFKYNNNQDYELNEDRVASINYPSSFFYNVNISEKESS